MIYVLVILYVNYLKTVGYFIRWHICSFIWEDYILFGIFVKYNYGHGSGLRPTAITIQINELAQLWPHVVPAQVLAFALCGNIILSVISLDVLMFNFNVQCD